MTLAILKTGQPPESLEPIYGGYPDMFTRLLGDPAAPFATFDVTQGQWPTAPDAFSAYVVTGSSAGVYDDEAWIAPLKAFLGAAKGKAALVGICFGHQIMAEAFGGTVIKSPKGWGVGLHHYDVVRQEPWMTDPSPTIAIAASHQDQVVEPPPGAEVIVSSPFTPYAGLAYRDQPAISFQCHPEFEPAYAAALIESRRGHRFDDATADAGIASLAAPNDRARVGAWIKRFVQQARG